MEGEEPPPCLRFIFFLLPLSLSRLYPPFVSFQPVRTTYEGRPTRFLFSISLSALYVSHSSPLRPPRERSRLKE